jgi:predicted nucleotidyltransferase component of viral defense system
MINKEEIERKAREFEISTANVERDYVFGWLLAGIYTASDLRNVLIFKGGNCFRKAYFPLTRFSNDLDFSTQTAVAQEFLRAEFLRVCDFAASNSGIQFQSERMRVDVQQQIDGQRTVYDIRIYFKDFYGNPDTCTISVSLDVVQLDQIYLVPQRRALIHPYSDSDNCRAELRCLKLEEMLASKLKCLLQRRHIADLYDLAFSVIVNRDIDVNRREVVSTFLKKTVFEPSPLTAKQALLDLPLNALRDGWAKYIVCPVQSVLDWDAAVTALRTFVESLFVGYVPTYAAANYFPSRVRAAVLDAGTDRRILRLRYHGVTRLVEPYSLVFKRRKDGVGQEYLYVYDLTGGRTSGPGIKSLIHDDIERVEVTDQRFTPRFPVLISRGREFGEERSFSSRGLDRRSATPRLHVRHERPKWRYTYQCIYCGREFVHERRNSSLHKHNDGYGDDCYGRRGTFISHHYS